MRIKIPHVVAAAAVSGFLVFAGVSLASAQTTPGTTPGSTAPSTEGTVPSNDGTTPAPGAAAPGAATPPAHNGDSQNCPNMGGSSGGTGQAKTTSSGPHNRVHSSSGSSSSAV